MAPPSVFVSVFHLSSSRTYYDGKFIAQERKKSSYPEERKDLLQVHSDYHAVMHYTMMVKARRFSITHISATPRLLWIANGQMKMSSRGKTFTIIAHNICKKSITFSP